MYARSCVLWVVSGRRKGGIPISRLGSSPSSCRIAALACSPDIVIESHPVLVYRDSRMFNSWDAAIPRSNTSAKRLFKLHNTIGSNTRLLRVIYKRIMAVVFNWLSFTPSSAMLTNTYKTHTPDFPRQRSRVSTVSQSWKPCVTADRRSVPTRVQQGAPDSLTPTHALGPPRIRS